jgi:UDP-N-acetylmuramate dehydrogenase
MQYLSNVSLKPFNTFGIDSSAKELVEVCKQDDLAEVLVREYQAGRTPLILGGGSNVLFTRDVDGMVVLNRLKGIKKVKEDNKNVWIKVGAGETWHKFVLWCFDQNLAGVENMSLIPGSVGAAPMQNIGAYGVELRSVFDSLEAIERATGETHQFYNSTCEFGYRSSIFKTHAKNQFVITSVTFKLNKEPSFNTSYGAIEQELESSGVKELSIKAISDAVIRIRQSKLPDPEEIGNAGSFFKNPVITTEAYEELKTVHPTIPGYTASEGYTKVAAGWLIDQAGWKGRSFGSYGVHKRQALVLVNYGGATGKQVFDLSADILADIHQKFGIELEREVNII